MERNVKLWDRAAVAICLLACLVISWMVHDKFSWGPDDGFYAYMAERMAAGDVIHKDLQILHPGLLYFLHEGLFKIFGEGFVSLRYPLIIITMLQTALAFKIARPYGLLTAVAAALALTAFSFVQFVNATPNWYLVFFAILIGYVIDKTDGKTTRALLFIGFLVGVSFLFRQLTGVFFAMGVTAVLFLKVPQDTPHTQGKTGSVILILLGLSLLAYLLSSAKSIGLLLFGIWPPLFLFCAATRCHVNWRTAVSICSKLLLGALISAFPLIFYHLATGSIPGLIHETFIAPFTYHGLGFTSENSYLLFPFIALRELANGHVSAVFGFIYWTLLLLLNATLAIIIIRRTLSRQGKLSAVAVLAIFHSLVALILEIPLYLNYAIGPVLLALLITSRSSSRQRKLAVLTIILSLTAVIFGAGQPMERGRENTILLKKADWASQTLPGTSLYASEKTSEFYKAVINLVDKCSSPEKNTIYAFPSHPEIYALSKRKSAFRFTGSYLGLTNADQVKEAAGRLTSPTGPAMIIHNTTDVYNTRFADDLFTQARANYQLIETIEPFEVFVRIDTLGSFPNCHSDMNR